MDFDRRNMNINDLFLDQNFLSIMYGLQSFRNVKQTLRYESAVFVIYDMIQELNSQGFKDMSEFLSNSVEISNFIFKVKELIKND